MNTSLLKAAADLLYPPACAGCGRSFDAARLCPSCEREAPRIQAPFCARCSQPFQGALPGDFTCAECESRGYAFECAVSRYRARGVVRDLILRFKYRRQHHLRLALADWLFETLDDPRIRAAPIDALVPVPLHPRKQRERGFNQASALCALVARRANLPSMRALGRVRWTQTQTRLDRDERMENLRGAFRVRRDVAGARLILVDDVFTTGSTVDECARTLRAAGAQSVRVITVARG